MPSERADHPVSEAPLLIPERYRGPPLSANGGYACGVIAAHVVPRPGLAVEVSLRAPPPLDIPMTVLQEADGVRVMHGETLVATAHAAALDLEVPPAPTPEAASSAMTTSPAHWEDVNPLLEGRIGVHPICFCCGDEVAEDEGLRVQPGRLDHARAAGLWTPNPAFGNDAGELLPEHIWTALDCPGEFAWYERGEDGSVRNGALLARLTAVIDAPVPVGEPCIVLGWRLGEEGRKYEAGTALYALDGTVLARARALWIRFDPSRMKG